MLEDLIEWFLGLWIAEIVGRIFDLLGVAGILGNV